MKNNFVHAGLVKRTSNEIIVSRAYGNQICVSRVITSTNDNYSIPNDIIIISENDTTGFFFKVSKVNSDSIMISYYPNVYCNYIEVLIEGKVVLKADGCSIMLPLDMCGDQPFLKVRAYFHTGGQNNEAAIAQRIIYADRILNEQNYYPDIRVLPLLEYADSVFGETNLGGQN